MRPMVLRSSNGLHGSHLGQRGRLRHCAAYNDHDAPRQRFRTAVGEYRTQVP